MQVLATRDSWWITQVEALLDSEGIEARWVPAELHGVVLLDVPASNVEYVADALSEQMRDELDRRADVPAPASVGTA